MNVGVGGVRQRTASAGSKEVGVMEITLTASEIFVLREALEKAINDMLMEIANTDHRKMREALKEREEILKTILEKLPAEVSTGA